MGLKPSLDLRQGTRLALSPQMRQSLALLRMPAADLAEAVAQAVAENPFLRLMRRPSMAGGAAYDMALATVASHRGLVEDLTHQLRAQGLPPDILALAETLAGELREDGYLDVALDTLAEDLGLTLPPLDAALKALQSCEPSGVGARDLAECLTLQLVDAGLSSALAGQVVAHLDDFADQRLGALVRHLNLPESEVRRIAGLIRGISSHPVRVAEAPAATLLPDLSVHRAGDGSLAVTLSSGVPVLRIDTRLAARGGFEGGAEAQLQARALIRALSQRGATLLAVGEAIIARQSAFFLDGPDRLRPLRRQDLAEELGVHASTLGRAVAGKGLEMEGRVYPLSLFFATPAPGEGDASLSAFALRRTIARMIAAEPPEAPLSDGAIVLRLNGDGVDIARRTVAKYRQSMKIPPSHRRRVRGGSGGGGR